MLGGMTVESLPQPVTIGAGQMRSFEVDMFGDFDETVDYVTRIIKDMTKSHLVPINCESL